MTLLLVLSAIILLIMISKLTFRIQIKRDDEEDIVKFSVIYLKFIKYKHQIPFVDISNQGDTFGLKIIPNIFSKGKDTSDKSFINFEELVQNINKIKKYYNMYKHSCKKILNHLQHSIKIKKVKFKIEIGIIDAAVTAIITGMIHSVIWNAIVFISYTVPLQEKDINIIPQFNTQTFKIDTSCIFTISIGNIIYVCIRVLFLFLFFKLSSFKKTYPNAKTY